MIGYIYLTTNLKNNKIYVGSMSQNSSSPSDISAVDISFALQLRHRVKKILSARCCRLAKR